MGYLLRTAPRTDVADMKYGENHMKTAYQLGLCDIFKCVAYPNTFGRIFIGLPEEERKKLEPRLCLYVPFMTTMYIMGSTDKTIGLLTSDLSESTKKRRLSNIRKLKSIIEKELSYE